MKTKQLQLLTFISVLLLSSCIGLNRSPYTNEPLQTNVVLSQANYRILKQVEGEWSCRYIFGIGGMNKETVTTNALSVLYKNAQLRGNQQIINITTTVSVRSWLGIVVRYTVIARGYVIEFLPLTSVAPSSTQVDQKAERVVVNEIDDVVVGQQSSAVPATLTESFHSASVDAWSHAFPVSKSGNKVYFSKGNLQYQASTATWRFAENQYDMIGEDNMDVSSSYSGWIDLFGWGTGDNPTLTSSNAKDYGTFTDWGVNAISNGGNASNQWRTLTLNEWRYLLKVCAHGRGRVCGVSGFILLPSDCLLPVGLSFNTNVKNYTTNQYNQEQWRQMEHAGAVFLPASGCRYGRDGRFIGYDGFYWFATSGNSSEYAKYFLFDFEQEYNYSNYRNIGMAVRLVQDAK